MSYEPVDQIPLQDMSSASIPDTIEESELSETSEIFTEIENYNHKNADLEDFSVDPTFQNTLSQFQGATGISRKACFAVSGSVFVLWLIALIIYSNGNAGKVASGIWHGSTTNQVLLLNRNITLNAFLPQNANVTFENYRRGDFYPDHKSICWLSPAQFPQREADKNNGYYLVREGHKILIRQANTDYEHTVLENAVFAYENTFFVLQDLILNPGTLVDNEDAFHLIKSDVTRQWRHSSFSLYWLWQPVTGNVIPVQPPKGENSESIEKLHFAEFSPDGKYLILGHNQDLYAMEVSTRAIATLAKSDDRNIFHGKPDWVYEEEIIADEKVVWWSPDLKRVVFASMDDSDVPEYELTYYVKNEDEVAMTYKRSDVHQYPVHTKIHYPKTGTPNPKLTLRIFDLELQTVKAIENLADEHIGEEFLLYDASWIDSDNILLKLTDRTSTTLVKKVYVASRGELKNVSKVDTSEFNGWVEKAQPIVPVTTKDSAKYLDKVVVGNLVQLALFDLATAELYLKLLGPVHYDGAVAYDSGENAVFAIWGTNLNQTFGLVSLADGLTRYLNEKGKIDLAFSPDGHFVELSYSGPNEPYQKLVNLAEFSDPSFSLDTLGPINNIKALTKTLQNTNIPTKVRSKVKVGHGKEQVELDIIEIFPPNFDPNQKHPLLINAYGGPGSTAVDYSFDVGFHEIVSAQLNTIVLIIDPRGTGSDDWNLKQWAYKKMGHWEPRDITSVVEDYVKVNKYVDDKKTATWGWSYGGFTALKTLEYDAGKTIKYGMAVAPVTSWMFYDSVYTERYMKSPNSNENYDKVSEITQYENFKNVQRFLIMHGTADDNVHLQNSLWLLDHFDTTGVENYDMHFFPDSDHSIYYHNANAIIYDKLFSWLKKAFEGKYT